VPEDHSHTGHQEVIPGNLAVAKHPGQGGQRIGAEAGPLKFLCLHLFRAIANFRTS
jgi:hypothetical protein